MNNKRFLVCPHCHLEQFIKNNYGDDSFFLTALGAEFRFKEKEFLESIQEFIDRESIKEILIVKDTTCGFIKSTLEEEKGFSTYAEKSMLNILIENYSQFMINPSISYKRRTLAYLSIENQVKEILKFRFFRNSLISERILIKGVILSKEEKQLTETEFKLKDFGNEFKLTN